MTHTDLLQVAKLSLAASHAAQEKRSRLLQFSSHSSLGMRESPVLAPTARALSKLTAHFWLWGHFQSKCSNLWHKTKRPAVATIARLPNND